MLNQAHVDRNSAAGEPNIVERLFEDTDAAVATVDTDVADRVMANRAAAIARAQDRQDLLAAQLAVQHAQERNDHLEGNRAKCASTNAGQVSSSAGSPAQSDVQSSVGLELHALLRGQQQLIELMSRHMHAQQTQQAAQVPVEQPAPSSPPARA